MSEKEVYGWTIIQTGERGRYLHKDEGGINKSLWPDQVESKHSIRKKIERDIYYFITTHELGFLFYSVKRKKFISGSPFILLLEILWY